MEAAPTSQVLVQWSGSGASTALIGFPWAGAGAGPFRPWVSLLEGVANLYGVRLPGRESRLLEPLPSSLAEVVDELLHAIAGLRETNVVLVGHCSGALLALAVARQLETTGDDRVRRVIVVSQLPPRSLTGPLLDPGDGLTDMVPVAMRRNREYLDLVMPILAADVSLAKEFVGRSNTALSSPISVFWGGSDETIDETHLRGWSHATNKSVSIRKVDMADHLFTGEAWTSLGSAVALIVGGQS